MNSNGLFGYIILLFSCTFLVMSWLYILVALLIVYKSVSLFVFIVVIIICCIYSIGVSIIGIFDSLNEDVIM